MINATHWLGALATVVGTIGIKDTPVRAMIHVAAQRIPTPVSVAALVVEGHELAGVFVGDWLSAWSAAADLSSERHIRWCVRPYRRVLSCAPAMYDELRAAAKAMYKLEPAVLPGGEVIIYAPHLETVSHVHGKYNYEVGYHCATSGTRYSIMASMRSTGKSSQSDLTSSKRRPPQRRGGSARACWAPPAMGASTRWMTCGFAESWPNSTY